MYIAKHNILKTIGNSNKTAVIRNTTAFSRKIWGGPKNLTKPKTISLETVPRNPSTISMDTARIITPATADAIDSRAMELLIGITVALVTGLFGLFVIKTIDEKPMKPMVIEQPKQEQAETKGKEEENRIADIKDTKNTSETLKTKEVQIKYLEGKGKLELVQPVPILTYHDISESKKGRFRLPAYEFENQLRYIKENGFSTVTLSSLFNGTIPENAVILTFDDITLNFYKRVYPLLKKYGMKATGFVIVYGVSSKGSSKITWKMLREMESSGLVDFESHTMNHLNLPKCSPQTVKTELSMSKGIIEAKLDKVVNFIAWPYGEYNTGVEDIAKQLGYKGLVTFGYDSSLPNMRIINLSKIGRVEVNGNLDISGFGRIMGRFKKESNDRIKVTDTNMKPIQLSGSKSF